MFRFDPYLGFLLIILLTYLSPVALVLAIVFLAVPRLRRNRRYRIAAYVCIAWLVVALSVDLATTIPMTRSMQEQDRYREAHTRQLSQPETIDGNQYPARTTLHLREDGHSVNAGTLPAPTLVNGLPVTGDFALPADEAGIHNKITGTLTQPRMLADIPCAPGPFAFSTAEVACTLARPITMHGFQIAGGTRFALLHESGEEHITELTLAAPITLFDSPFPAGSILQPMRSNASDIEHLAQNTSGSLDVCLPAGSTLMLGQARLVGTVDLAYNVDRIEVVYGCPGVHPSGNTGPAGFIDYQGKHFQSGSLDLKTHLWSELDPVPAGGSR